MFETQERPLLKGLPVVPYEISTWVPGRHVGRNGHVVWGKNSYSVPFAHIGAHVDLRVTDTILEVYRNDERLTSHLLLPAGVVHQYRTNDADLPEGHDWAAWDRHRIDAWAARIGEATVTTIDRIFQAVPVEEQGYDPALAVLRLSRRFSPARVDAACALALTGPVRSPRYAHLRPILDSGQDQARHLPEPADDGGYVRGGDYYAGDVR